jgi:glutathione S-transferase
MVTMKLRYAPTSPYVRKVTVLALEAGLDGKIERIPTASAPDKPNPELGRENPLNKVPCLLTDDGLVLYDSPVICEYLDAQHSGRKLFPAGNARWTALRQMALADGILDAALLRRYEGLRPENERSTGWDKAQKLKIEQSLDSLEGEVNPDPAGDQISIGHVSVGCALGYLDFRFAHEDWRKGRPNLAKWYEGMAKRPSMAMTVPPA